MSVSYVSRTVLGALIVAVFAACSASGSSGPGGTSEGASKPEGASDFCGATAAYPRRCAGAEATACEKQIASACSGMAGGLLNPSLLDAAGACVASTSCGTSPTSCLATALTKAQPTDAHRALAKAYCAQCTEVPAGTCEEAFFKNDGDASALAELILPVGDGLAKSITDKCVGFTCKATFLTCAQGMIAKQLADSLTPAAAQCVLKAIAGKADLGSGSSSTSSSSSGSSTSSSSSSSSSSGSSTSSSSSSSSSSGSSGSSGGTSGSFDIEVVDATIPSTKSSGSAWDPFGGSPDPFVQIALANGTQGSSSYQSDTLSPTWNETILKGVAAQDLGIATVNVIDDDTISNDWIGSCVYSFLPQSGDQTITCDEAHSSFGPGYTLRVRLTVH